ncbi:hypothetical protein CS542_07795 [Pedobacter sp. IW39]|nr:hypothetical protein CS542_07795 [Pedobacter sp. IW39]
MQLFRTGAGIRDYGLHFTGGYIPFKYLNRRIGSGSRFTILSNINSSSQQLFSLLKNQACFG